MHAIRILGIFGYTTVGMLAGAGVCHAVPKLGGTGRRVAVAFCQAPGLDVLVTYFTVLPIILGAVVGGWVGAVAGVAGQVVGMLVWERIHEAANRPAVRGPRLVKVVNAKIGWVRNHGACWVTACVTPVFWFVRVGEVLAYPLLTRIAGLPAYTQRDWVNVSRQKFDGLVGHDLIWCLYCDWMTGVWSLGTEMLRNVESFWCPIRFRSDKKCVNCSIDFPDVDHGWVPADGTMADVTRTWERMYADQSDHAWFGHPVRLTVNGRPAGGANGALVERAETPSIADV